MDWFDPDQNRGQWRDVWNTVMNLRVPQNSGMFLSICTTCGIPRREGVMS
jgi:hypothetical protein